MLQDGTVVATIAVKDKNAGKEFYGGTLGLQQMDENPAGVTYSCGEGSLLFVYESSLAGTNQATYAFWRVKNAEAVVEELKSKGVTFEHYDDMPGEWQGDLLVGGGMKGGWFKDPDGNVLSIVASE